MVPASAAANRVLLKPPPARRGLSRVEKLDGEGAPVLAALAPVEGLVTIEHVLDIPAVKMHTVSGFETAVFPYTTDVPVLTRWGRPLLIGPGAKMLAASWLKEVVGAGSNFYLLALILLARGPAPRPEMVIFRFAKWISEGEPVEVFGDGEQSRGFTYLDDIVRGTIAALKPMGYEIINLGGHQPLNLNELIRILEKRIGKKATVMQLPPNPADIRASLANVDKARRLLDWQPEVGLEEGIGRLVDWYNTEREWARETIKP